MAEVAAAAVANLPALGSTLAKQVLAQAAEGLSKAQEEEAAAAAAAAAVQPPPQQGITGGLALPSPAAVLAAAAGALGGAAAAAAAELPQGGDGAAAAAAGGGAEGAAAAELRRLLEDEVEAMNRLLDGRCVPACWACRLRPRACNVGAAQLGGNPRRRPARAPAPPPPPPRSALNEHLEPLYLENLRAAADRAREERQG